MGVWGQRPQQAEAYAEGKGSEHASDPCRRHGQKLVTLKITALPEKKDLTEVEKLDEQAIELGRGTQEEQN